MFHYRARPRPGGAALTDAAAADDPTAAPASAPTPKKAHWGKYGRRPLGVLALVAFIDALDRGILPGALTEVQDDFGFGDTAAGFLGTAFVLTGFLVTIPSGYLADRYRRTRIIAVVMASWGVISALNSVVRSYGQFLAVRAALGVGETIDNPSSQSLLADYYPVATRGRAYAYHRILPFVGAALGTVLGGVVAATLGWRWAFLLVGVPGSLLAIAGLAAPGAGPGRERRGGRDRPISRPRSTGSAPCSATCASPRRCRPCGR